uniref:Uncharacterized protein n=1 Tax=Solanum tuberosum TaxID=4113 RepID=M1DNT5_SOLTU
MAKVVKWPSLAKPGKVCVSRGVAGLNSTSWVESRHVGFFGKLGQASRNTWQFVEGPHLIFNFILYLMFASIIVGEKFEIAEGTR